MKIFLAAILFLSVGSAVAKRNPASWVMSDRYEKKRGSDINQSVIQFQKGSASVTYRPEEPPYGMVSNERFLLGTNEYFLTGWAKGARTVLFRVFMPEKHGSKTLCEITSFAESSALKIEGDATLKIKTIELESEEDFKWVDCKIN